MIEYKHLKEDSSSSEHGSDSGIYFYQTNMYNFFMTTV